jgi:cell division protein FtsN
MGITVRQSNKTTSLVEYARGSLINDRRTHYLAGDNRTNVGRGGITIMPFVDYNSNGRRDKGEPAAAGLNIHTNGGRIIRNESDTTIRILGLEPYTNCFIELDPNSFENISWRLSKKTFSVVVDPEILKTLEVPVKVVGEADGTVTLAKDGKEEGIGRIILGFFRQNGSRVTKVLTEDDGYFSYFGFEPGKYFVRVDTSQLLRLGYYSDPDTIGFTITAGADGDMVSGLDFKLREHIKDTAGVRQVTKPEAPVVKKDTITTIIHEVTEELFTIAEDSYAVQLGAFRLRSNAEAYKNKLSEQLGKKVEIVVEGELFKVRVVDLKERADVESLIEVLKKNGISELWIITLKARKQEWRLVQKIDTVTTVKETTDDGSKVIPSDLVIQTGAFRNEKYAAAMQEKLAALSGKPIVVLFEDGYYKVRVSGFRDKQELVKMLPSFAAMGYKDVWVPKAIVLRETVNQDSVRIPVQERTLVIADTVAKPVEKKEEKVVEEKKEEELKAEEIKVEEKKVEEIKVEEKKEKVIIPVEQKVEEKKADDKKPEEIKPEVKRPTVYLRVGEFRKKSQALKAQRKISAKLDLESEILMDWESFYLLIPGFYTREETFPLYPELAGLGITKISVVQEK